MLFRCVTGSVHYAVFLGASAYLGAPNFYAIRCQIAIAKGIYHINMDHSYILRDKIFEDEVSAPFLKCPEGKRLWELSVEGRVVS